MQPTNVTIYEKLCFIPIHTQKNVEEGKIPTLNGSELTNQLTKLGHYAVQVPCFHRTHYFRLMYTGFTYSAVDNEPSY